MRRLALAAGRAATLALLGCALGIPGVAREAAAQGAGSALESQGLVDGVVRSLLEASALSGAGVVAEVLPSESFFAGASGNRVTVTTRFLREASREALAAVIAGDLFADPVQAAVALHRAGFDGPGGLAELHARQGRWVALEARRRAEVESAYRDFHAESSRNALRSSAPQGYQVMAAARVQAARARYEQAVAVYQATQAEARAGRLVTAAEVQALGEITSVLRGQTAVESSPWGPRVRSTLEDLDRPAAQPPR